LFARCFNLAAGDAWDARPAGRADAVFLCFDSRQRAGRGYSQSLRLNRKYNPIDPTAMSSDEVMSPEVLAKPG
jgi:hypothetical protein